MLNLRCFNIFCREICFCHEKYSQLLWDGMADVIKYKKWKMLKVKLQFFVEKREAATCFYYKATSQNYSLGGKWAATRPHNWKICQKYLTCLFFSSALTLYIFTHSWCQKKNMDLFCVGWRNFIRGNGEGNILRSDSGGSMISCWEGSWMKSPPPDEMKGGAVYSCLNYDF